jgi:hypothetical protein
MTNEQTEYLKDIIKGHLVSEIIELYYKKYKVELDKKQIRAFKRKYKLISGVDTKFKKQQISHNYKPIGYEFTRNDGYIMIKVDEHKWKQKHRYIYEQHYGKIPNGYSIVFLDRNKANCDIDNLMLVKKSEKLLSGKYNLIFDNKELTKTGILTMKLKMKTRELSKQQ